MDWLFLLMALGSAAPADKKVDATANEGPQTIAESRTRVRGLSPSEHSDARNMVVRLQIARRLR